MANDTEKEKQKNKKEYAATSLKNGVPQANIALHLVLADFFEVEPEAVRASFDANTKLVQEAFREL